MADASAPGTAGPPRRTALYERHVALGARFTEFGGWQMPVRYGPIIEEHQAVRTAAGLFDLSHMGQLRVSGPGAVRGLAASLVSDPGRLAVGQAGYSMICAPDGGIIDDLIVYRTGEAELLVVPNAANREVVADALRARLASFEATLDDETLATSLVAIQGPAAAGILASVTEPDPAALGYYSARPATVAGIEALVARTGYTGEDGFELFVTWDDGPMAWDALLAAGADDGLVPCGLGARDTLRLEAGMPLYGHELDRETTPYEAGLGRVVKLDRQADFVGRAALEARSGAPGRQLVGLVLEGRAIARAGHPVARPGEEDPIGVVTSGSQSPTLGTAIAMAYVPPADAVPGTMLAVAVRGTAVPAVVVRLPFYRRPGRLLTAEETDVDVPETLRYSDDHEWLRTEGDEGVVGITAYAADELGDIVFVEMPEIGRKLRKDEAFGVIESVKTASDLYAPAAGEVVAINEALADAPELVNSEPYEGGWMVRLRLDEPAAGEALMDADAYREKVGG